MTEQANSLVTIDYTNWRGERRERQVIVHRMIFGSNEWHPEPQWLLLAMDPEDKKEKTFAMSGIHSWNRRSPPPAVEGGWRDVLAERERQKTVKGWTSEHDDDHDNGELVHAEWGAMGRLKQAASLIGLYSPVPAEARKLLVESAALILAEVERIDRATVSTDLREPWRDFRSYSTNERLLAEFKWTDGRVAVGQWSAHGYWMRHVGGTMRQETINRKFETVTYDVMTVVLAKAPDGVYPTDWRPLPTPPAGEKP